MAELFGNRRSSLVKSDVIPGLSAKTVFVFDWDGTLFDSMDAKTRSFAGVMHDWLVDRGVATSVDEVARLYRLYSGIPRREIFRRIAAGVGIEVSDADCEELSLALFARNRDGLESALLFGDALPCLYVLLAAGRTLCLSSSVPQAELSYFVERKLPADVRVRLAAVLGSGPGLGKGRGHLGVIAAATGAGLAATLVVGDDLADRDLSREAGVESVLVDRDGHLPPQTPHISSLNEITRLL